MYERPTGNRNNETNFGVLKNSAPENDASKITLRHLLFSSAMLFAIALGCYHLYSEAAETGILRFGGRAPRVIVKAIEPQSFEVWSNFFVVSSAVFCAIGVLSLYSAWRRWRAK